MTIKFLVISILSVSLVCISCSNNNEESKNKIHEETEDSITVNAEPVDANEMSYNLPSALQIAYVFKKSGAGFDPVLPNNNASVNKYNISNYKRAVNFGVYSADLAYCLFNKKYSESKEYLKACKDLGSSLGLNQAFESDNAAQRFDKNITNEDSVVKIVSNVQMKTDIMFEENKQKHIAIIAFTGAWTESAYIACEVYAKEKNKKVLSSLLEQLLLSESIIKALKNCETSEPEIKSLLLAVEQINNEFNAISSVKTAVEKGEEPDFTTMIVTNEEIAKVSQLIKTLRTGMVD